jgi:flagellar basal-body rod modification protein FlgD
MAISSINNAATSSAASTGNNVNRFAELSSEEFMKVLFTELQNQDPLNPQDSSKMLEQLSSLRNIESQVKLQDQLADLVSQNQVAAAGNLIGKAVQGLDETNKQTTGLVTSVRVTSDGVKLQLDNGSELDMARVTAIANASALTTS